MIASPQQAANQPTNSAVAQPGDQAAQRPAAPSEISPRQRWAHLLVLDMIDANLPLARLAEHLKIPFDTLVAHINSPEVQAEIDAYEALTNLRARLLGEAARPISLRRLLDALESPAPRPSGRDSDADQRAIHRHAELIRRTATTIARESRALVPKPLLAPKPAADRRSQEGAPSASSGSSADDLPSRSNELARQEVSPVPAELTSEGEAALVRDMPAPPTPSPTPGRTEAPARHSPTDALRAAAGSTHTVRDPSRRSRDRPAA
jgi:hypothetical protein